jgi:tetratricopeptide (TPR) repeat protein
MSVKTCFIAGAIATGVMALASITCGPPASAQTQQQIDACGLKNKPTNEQQIDGCTAVIQSTWYSGNTLAAAFYNRANAYNRKGEYDWAIADYDQAIKLEANFVLAFYNRGNAYGNKGQLDRAIQDFNQAIKLDPKNAYALRSRSIAKAQKGDKAGAAADLAQAQRLDPNIK